MGGEIIGANTFTRHGQKRFLFQTCISSPFMIHEFSSAGKMIRETFENAEMYFSKFFFSHLSNDSLLTYLVKNIIINQKLRQPVRCATVCTFVLPFLLVRYID